MDIIDKLARPWSVVEDKMHGVLMHMCLAEIEAGAYASEQLDRQAR